MKSDNVSEENKLLLVGRPIPFKIVNFFHVDLLGLEPRVNDPQFINVTN